MQAPPYSIILIFQTFLFHFSFKYINGQAFCQNNILKNKIFRIFYYSTGSSIDVFPSPPWL